MVAVTRRVHVPHMRGLRTGDGERRCNSHDGCQNACLLDHLKPLENRCIAYAARDGLARFFLWRNVETPAWQMVA